LMSQLSSTAGYIIAAKTRIGQARPLSSEEAHEP
jgi:hypothetical protein